MLTYSEFITRYLNKHNPATGMFWLLADIAIDAGVPVSLITEFRNRAQDELIDEPVDISEDVDYIGIDDDEIAIITECGGRGQPRCDDIEDDFIDDFIEDDEIIDTVKNKGMLYLGLSALAFVILSKR